MAVGVEVQKYGQTKDVSMMQMLSAKQRAPTDSTGKIISVGKQTRNKMLDFYKTQEKANKARRLDFMSENTLHISSDQRLSHKGSN